MAESFRERGGWWVVGQSVLMIAIGCAGPVFGVAVDDWLRVVAIVLGSFGAGIGIAGVINLGKNRTAYPAPKVAGKLVRHGVYAHVRHPLYTSMILLGTGWALGWGSSLALLLTVGFGFLLDAKAEEEERRLVSLFPEYDSYRRTVPRFVPSLIRRHPGR